MDTEIIGISHLEREVVANIVRYNIQEYAYDEVILESDLSQYAGLGTSRRDLTILIAKLTAILRSGQFDGPQPPPEAERQPHRCAERQSGDYDGLSGEYRAGAVFI